MIDGVELLGFDVFGTVVDWRGSVARHAERFLRAHGIAADPVAFAVAWRDLYQPSMEEVRSGRRPWVRLSVLNRESLLALLARHGVSEGAIPSEAIDELNRAWERLDPWPDVAQGLARLRRRFLLGTISNGHLAGMMRLARHRVQVLTTPLDRRLDDPASSLVLEDDGMTSRDVYRCAKLKLPSKQDQSARHGAFPSLYWTQTRTSGTKIQVRS